MDHIHSGKLNGFIPMNFIRSSIFKMPVLQLDKSELSAVGDDDVAMVSLILTPDVGLLRVREVRQLLQLDRQTSCHTLIRELDNDHDSIIHLIVGCLVNEILVRDEPVLNLAVERLLVDHHSFVFTPDLKQKFLSVV